MAITVTQTIPVDPIIKEQFLSTELDESVKIKERSKKIQFKAKIVWRNVFLFGLLHIGSLVGLYQLLVEAKWPTVFWWFTCWTISGVAITAGAHRLWSHKGYKARFPLRLMLMIMDCFSFQNHVIEWARDHRCHHKWTDTDADPHNINRGFFFAHMGWLLMKKHPLVIEKGKTLDLSDLYADPLLVFQKKFYLPLTVIFCFLVPALVPVFFWNENPVVAFYTCSLFRYCISLHATWFINSAAHSFGYRPYDIGIAAVESVWTTLTAFGEGGHNYHHTFPQDYRTSEIPALFNVTKLFIDIFSKIGWAYDLKVVPEESIKRQVDRQYDNFVKMKNT